MIFTEGGDRRQLVEVRDNELAWSDKGESVIRQEWEKSV
jgi:hypothetical protein